MNCSITGELAQEPVVSKKSGLVFEKRLIERHIAEFGKCPVTGEATTMDDIIPVQSGKMFKPRPIAAASIPGMLGMFQTEWDTLMLSNLALEKQLHMSRQELSYALYQHDAACRVISRLKKERDEARSLLGQSMNTTNEKRDVKTTVAEDESNGPDEKKLRLGIPSDIIDELSDCNISVSQERKKRTVSLTLAPVNDVERYTQLSSHPLHKTTTPGILSVDIHYSKDLIVTGGVDSNAVVFDHSSSEIISTLAGHSKKVNCVKIVPQDDPFVITGSADATVRLWKGSDSGNYECKHVLKDHQKSVQAVAIHNSNKYLATASLDKKWCFYDLSTGLCLAQATDPSESSSLGYSSAAFHPDGLLLGAGTSEALVRVWDLKSQENLATLEGHTGAVTSVSFSENGFVLATAADDGVRLWDLRYLRNFQSFSPYGQKVATNFVHFDHSNSYLAVGGEDARIYQVGGLKTEWNCFKILPDLSGTGKVTSVRFGPDAKYISVGSMDHNLRIFGLPVPDASV